MSVNNSLPTVSASFDKNNLSTQKDLTTKMMNDIKILKNSSLSKEIKNLQLNRFHHNSLLNSFNLESLKAHTKQNSQNFIQTSQKYIPQLDLYNSYSSNKTLSFGSLSSSIQNYTHGKLNSNSYTFRLKKSRNIKIEFLRKFKPLSPKAKRNESLSEFKKKTKSIFFEKYFIQLKEKDIKSIQDDRTYAIELTDLKINNLKKMINLLNILLRNQDKYINHLKSIITKENIIKNDLIDKKKEILHETNLLRYRFERTQRTFELLLENKFFLLCVKNETNIFDKFLEKDKNEYNQDRLSLYLISDFNRIQRKMEKKKTISVKGSVKRYSILEEKISNGIKIIKDPKPVFSSPDDFYKKFEIISDKIQDSIFTYNQKNIELMNLREYYNEKKKEYKKEEEMCVDFQEDISLAEKKLEELKMRNEFLNKYFISLSKKPKDNILLVEKKVKEIHKKINKIDEFIREKIFKLDDTETTITRLLDIENKLYFLIKYIKEYKLHNKDNYKRIEKFIDLRKRLKGYELVKLKKLEELHLKEKKIIAKNNKVLFKPLKKVGEIFNFNKNQ